MKLNIAALLYYLQKWNNYEYINDDNIITIT